MSIRAFLLERYFAQHEFRVSHQLCNSDCEALSQAYLLSLADRQCSQLWEDLSLGYTEVKGLPLLRAEICSLYPGTTPDQIQCVAPEEGIYIAMRVLLGKGDKVVATTPGYQSLTELCLASGAEVIPWRVSETDQGFHFDVDALEALLAKHKPKLVVVNFPHNPTGAQPSQDEWEWIYRLAEANGARLFSDEMYRMLEYNEEDRLPSAFTLGKKHITLSGLSKSWGCPGLRLGWLASQDTDFLAAVSSYRDYVTICGAAPAEVLALIALRNTQKIIDNHRRRVMANLETVREFCMKGAAASLVEWREPKAGPMALLRLKNGVSAEKYAERMIAEQGLLLLPSTMYEYGDSHLRLGLGRENCKECVEVWRKGLEGDGK